MRRNVPLEIDMTCSGLSLFSGVLWDPVGMTATNALMTADRLLQDAYQNVVEKAIELLEILATLEIRTESNELPWNEPANLRSKTGESLSPEHGPGSTLSNPGL